MKEKKAIVIYICLTFVLTWLIWLGLWSAGVQLGQPLSQLGTLVAMWMPALAYAILRKGRPEQYSLGAGFRLHLKERWPYYPLALWAPGLLTISGLIVYFLVFQQQFSLAFQPLADLLTQAGLDEVRPPLGLMVVAQIFSALSFAPFFNSLFALGEEIGWRGYLYPALRPYFSETKSHLLVGLIWSLWHLPLNLQGYNFGLDYWGSPWLGLLAMFVFCFSVGVLLSWVMGQTGSLWAPALLHGALNASAGLGLLFQASSDSQPLLTVLGPSPTGLLAGLPFLLVALLILSKERSGRK